MEHIVYASKANSNYVFYVKLNYVFKKNKHRKTHNV